MKLAGKTVLIVGATGGIGRQFSQAFSKECVNLILVSRKMDSLKVLEKELAFKGTKTELFTCDLTDPGSIRGLVKKVEKNHKSVDVLIHLAGVGVYKKLPDIDIDEWNASLKINVTSVFYTIQKFLPLLKRSNKAYVIVSGSGMGKVAMSGRSAYCTSKFALRGLMLSLAKEYRKTNINFIHLTLGSVLTSFGPLSLKTKQRKFKKGKGYLDPQWLANHVVTRIEHDTLEAETPIYPRDYFLESKKDIR